MAGASASSSRLPAPNRDADLDPAPAPRFQAVVSLVGAAIFGIACVTVAILARSRVFGPVPEALFVTPFWTDAVAVARGAMPYRDFALEYPPLSLPFFVLPAVLPFGGTSLEDYRVGFEVIATVVGMAVVPVVVATVVRLGGRRSDVLVAAAVVAVSPLLVGPIAISRYDLWPALLAGAAVAALLWGRHRLGFALLALGILAKAYPAILVPIFLAWTWRRAGRAEALTALAILAAVVSAGLLPFVAIAPDGALAPFSRAIARPLQIESLGATALIALHDVVGLPLEPTVYRFESYNLEGSLPSAVSAVQSVVLGGFVIAIWAAAVRWPMTRGRFVLTCAAAICAFVAFGKVLSPQYILWLIPPLAVLGPTRGSRSVAGLLIVLILTLLYYPGSYARFVARFELSATVAVLERNIALVLLAAYLAIAAGTFDGLSRTLPRRPRLRRPGRPADRAPSGS